MPSWVSTLQSASPVIIAALTGIIGIVRVNGRAGRLQAQIKESIELAKSADEANLPGIKSELELLVAARLGRLRTLDQRKTAKQYDKSSLGVAAFLAAFGGSISWALLLPENLFTTILAWTIAVATALLVITGLIMFFTNGTKK